MTTLTPPPPPIISLTTTGYSDRFCRRLRSRHLSVPFTAWQCGPVEDIQGTCRIRDEHLFLAVSATALQSFE